jgi:hypothetical protein
MNTEYHINIAINGDRGEARPGARGAAPRKAKLYCPIHFVQTHHSLLGALLSVGLNHEDALVLVENAKVKQRRCIIANAGNSQCFVIKHDSEGVIEIWQAMTDRATPRRTDAEAFVMAQRDGHDFESKLAVFPLEVTACDGDERSGDRDRSTRTDAHMR